MGFLDSIKNLFRNRDRTHPSPPDGAYRNAVSLPGDLDDAPEWIRIVPIGEFPNHPDGAHTVSVDDVDEMVENFDRKDVDLLFDVDHDSLFGNTRAAAWGMELEARDDGLYARFPEFTPYGEELVANREYRYFSPVYALDVTNQRGDEIGARLFSVALTNTPYMDEGEIDAIGNTDDPSATTDSPEDDPSDPDEPDPDRPMERDELIDLLDLDEDATDEEIREALNELKEGEGEPDPDPAEPDGDDEPEDDESDEDEQELEEVVNSLRSEIQDLKEEREQDRAEQLVNSAIDDGKIAPAEKEVWLNSARSDYEGTKEKLDAKDEGSAMPAGVNTGDGDGGTGDDLISNTAQQVKAERGA